VQVDPQHPGLRTILGLVLGLPASQTVTAHLWRTDQAVATATVDEFGNFILDSLDPGVYDLILSGEKNEVHIQNLTL
jgi:hypothetical protein